jgi:hypothetical protein
VTGEFQGTATFGPGEVGQTQLAAVGVQDLFVARFDDDGTFRRVRSAGGSSAFLGAQSATAIGGTGDIAITGYINSVSASAGTVVFGPGDPGQTTLASVPAGRGATFVARYAPDLSLVRAKQPTSTGTINGVSVRSHADGSLVVTGSFNGDATFGAGEPGQVVLTSPLSGVVCYVARFAADGKLVWAKQTIGALSFGRCVTVLPSGATVVVGDYDSGPVTFGSGEAGATTLPAVNQSHAFAASYAANGSLLWVQDLGPGACDAVASFTNGTSIAAAYTSSEIHGFQITAQGAVTPSAPNMAAPQSNGAYARAVATSSSGAAFLAAQLVFPAGQGGYGGALLTQFR